jgi:hypothetical protein
VYRCVRLRAISGFNVEPLLAADSGAHPLGQPLTGAMHEHLTVGSANSSVPQGTAYQSRWRQIVGAQPTSRLKARENAASES